MLTKDGSRTLNSERYGETYHSINGALTEARHVFLDATGLTQRLKAGAPTNVLEIGFGLGLNTLLCADLADRHGANLEYHSFEHALVSAETLDELEYGQLLGNSQLADSLGDFVAGLHKDRLHSSDLQSADLHRSDLQSADFQRSGQHGIDQPENSPCNGSWHGTDLPGARQNTNDSHTTHISRKIELTLHLQDVSTVDFKARFHHRFHAIFLDAFSPETNTECWSAQFIARLAQALSRDGKLSTYSAKGAVRRAMLAAGLKVTKLPGPPGKREMLVAQW